MHLFFGPMPWQSGGAESVRNRALALNVVVRGDERRRAMTDMNDPRLDPRVAPGSIDYRDRGGMGSAGGLLAAIAVIVVVIAIIYGLSGTSSDNRTGQINTTPPAATKTTPPAPATMPPVKQ
jgi:hypothetical protein